MGVEIKLNDQHFPISPVFVDFLYRTITGKPFTGDWHDQLSEKLSSSHVDIAKSAAEHAGEVLASPDGQRYIGRAYALFVSLMTGDIAPLRDIQFRFHFVNVIGIPRNGGSYLTKEIYSALGHDPASTPGVVAHDGFPDASPFQLGARRNSWMTSLQTMAEYLTMVEIFFGQEKPRFGKIVVPKKLTKGSYAGGFFHQILGEAVEHVLTVRHPVACCISTYEKSGGWPEDGRFRVRSNIEEWMRRDLAYLGHQDSSLGAQDYFDVYLRYWEHYHYFIATTGLSAARNIEVVPYGAETMQRQAQRYHNRFESGRQAGEFHVFDKRDRHPEWFAKAEPAVRRVAELWKSVGLAFPLEAVMEAW